MSLALIAALMVFLTDSKAGKAILALLLPAAFVMSYFFKINNTSGTAFYAGLFILGASPFLELVCGKIGKKLPKRKPVEGRQMTSEDAGEDILDNKKKWRLIVAGYIFFIIFAVFSIASIIRLNTKINNMYEFSNSQQETIEEQQKLIEDLKVKVDKK